MLPSLKAQERPLKYLQKFFALPPEIAGGEGAAGKKGVAFVCVCAPYQIFCKCTARQPGNAEGNSFSSETQTKRV